MPLAAIPELGSCGRAAGEATQLQAAQGPAFPLVTEVVEAHFFAAGALVPDVIVCTTGPMVEDPANARCRFWLGRRGGLDRLRGRVRRCAAGLVFPKVE